MDLKTRAVLLFSSSLPVGSPGCLALCSCSKISVTEQLPEKNVKGLQQQDRDASNFITASNPVVTVSY